MLFFLLFGDRNSNASFDGLLHGFSMFNKYRQRYWWYVNMRIDRFLLFIQSLSLSFGAFASISLSLSLILFSLFTPLLFICTETEYWSICFCARKCNRCNALILALLKWHFYEDVQAFNDMRLNDLNMWPYELHTILHMCRCMVWNLNVGWFEGIIPLNIWSRYNEIRYGTDMTRSVWWTAIYYCHINFQ